MDGRRGVLPGHGPKIRPRLRLQSLIRAGRAVDRAAAVLYLVAVLAVRIVRISLLTCGAKGIRTPDLLHAISRQRVHPSTYVQVTVLGHTRKSACVLAGCCTFVLCAPRGAGMSRGVRDPSVWAVVAA